MSKSILPCLVLLTSVVACPSIAGAQTLPLPAAPQPQLAAVAASALPPSAPRPLTDPTHLSIRSWQFAGTPTLQAPVGPANPRRFQAAPARPTAPSTVKRVIAGVAFGVAGFFGGGALGAALEGDCKCDDPGLQGAIIGAPIGAAIGATLGAILVH